MTDSHSAHIASATQRIIENNREIGAFRRRRTSPSSAESRRKAMCRQTVRNEVPGARTLALSCHLNRASLARLLGHRIFSVVLRHSTLFFAARGSAAIGEIPGAPCTVRRSSTGQFSPPGCKASATSDPSRRILPSDLRGSVTGIPAWSRDRATGKIACFPSSLVCTSFHPLARSSSAQTTRAPRAPVSKNFGSVRLMRARLEACEP